MKKLRQNVRNDGTTTFLTQSQFSFFVVFGRVQGQRATLLVNAGSKLEMKIRLMSFSFNLQITFPWTVFLSEWAHLACACNSMNWEGHAFPQIGGGGQKVSEHETFLLWTDPGKTMNVTEVE